MLQPFTQCHAEVEAVADDIVGYQASSHHEFSSGFPDEIEKVMQQHPADDDDDEADVEI